MTENELLALLKKNTQSKKNIQPGKAHDIENLSDTVTEPAHEVRTITKAGGNDTFISAEALAQNKHKPGAATLRVAAYIRVSTDNAEQEDSYELQERYFTSLLTQNPMWTSAGVYSDYAHSGTDKDRHTGFKRLLRHCREGKIDRIITKSISRFARNTGDFLVAIDTLRENGVTVYFERENLDTANLMSGFIMTTLGAIAQEESRSISENMKWGCQKRFPNGEVKNIAIYGYRYADGEDAYVTTRSGYRYRMLEVVEEEAEVVRRVFREVADGKNYIEVARGLNLDGIPAPARMRRIETEKDDTIFGANSITTSTKGKARVDVGWTGARIGSMVKLERYAGDVHIQKGYTADYLTHEYRKNTGEMPMYYVKDHHPAIISRELFDEVQRVVSMNKGNGGTNGKRYPFSGVLVCAHCGAFYTTYNRNQHPKWVCRTAKLNNGKGACYAERIYEEQVIRMFRRAVTERYKLVEYVVRDDVNAADILSGRYIGSMGLAESGASFVSRMKARLEAVQKGDRVERDRSFMKRELLALNTERARLESRLRPQQTKKTTMQIRKEALRDGSVESGVVEEVSAECMELERRLKNNAETLERQKEKMCRLEQYWIELEDMHEWREKALSWIETLPEGKAGTVAFLNGLTDEYVKALALSITVHDPLHYTVHWFDDTKTEVQMYSNVESHKYTAAYWDGSVMREKPKRK